MSLIIDYTYILKIALLTSKLLLTEAVIQ